MKLIKTLIILFIIGTVGIAAADSPKKIVFIHHSSGGNLIADTTGSDGEGGLASELDSRGYFFSDISYGWDAPANANIGSYTDIGHWYTWFADTTDQSGTPRRDNIMGAVYIEYDQDAYSATNFGPYTRTVVDPGGENTIVMIKSCYPNADIYDDNSTGPTDLYGQAYNYQVGGQYVQTESNVRAVYNQMLEYFKLHTDKMFIVFTNLPLNASSTSADRALNMREFANWLYGTWLSAGDWENKNVYVFDSYNVLTDIDNHHYVVGGVEVHNTEVDSSNYLQYAPTGDNHPNGTGNRKMTSELAPLIDLWFTTWQAWLNPSGMESRCNELGSNCVCSEPLGSTLTWGYVDNNGYDPDDSVTKECDSDGTGTGWFGWTENEIAMSNDSTILALLPSGHSVSNILLSNAGHTSTFNQGHTFSNSEYLVRTAIRWYEYRSSDYEFKDEGSCTNSKFFDFPAPHGDFNGTLFFYDFAGWSPDTSPNWNVDLTISNLKGIWSRWELIVVNRHGISQGANTYVLLYHKDVTNGTDEVLVMDSRDFYTGRSPDINRLINQLYRAGTCNGRIGFSHWMAAGWDTDEGQRIGAAIEVEGSGEATYSTCYLDTDGDGYGPIPAVSQQVEDPNPCPTNYYLSSALTSTTNDCDDTAASVNPAGTEICGDGIDQDCDGSDLVCPEVDFTKSSISGFLTGGSF